MSAATMQNAETLSTSSDEGEGVFVAIVGPSGSGKDSVINWLRERLKANAKVQFVQRVVTRETDSETEDHVSLSADVFSELQNKGAFAVSWEAHGLHYGIPQSVVVHIIAGGFAIANGSRKALPKIAAAFNNLIVINLTVEKDVLAARLIARGRESAGDVAQRLARMDVELSEEFNTIYVDNSGPLEQAGTTILHLVESFLQSKPLAKPLERQGT